MSNRSVAKADVAELTAALDSAVDQEKEHHLIICILYTSDAADE